MKNNENVDFLRVSQPADFKCESISISNQLKSKIVWYEFRKYGKTKHINIHIYKIETQSAQSQYKLQTHKIDGVSICICVYCIWNEN